MSSNYSAIRTENERRYGTDIGRIGKMLLADRYADRTHFIFELLQNAEDAMARRIAWQGSRSVRFHLTDTELRVSHFGHPFNDADVRGICGIDESTKGLTAIGRFGIGFKSVFAFTDRPELHSRDEDFAIESFVWPVAAPRLDQRADETIIILPLRHGDDAARNEITRGFKQLGLRTLLFLRHIEEIEWKVDGGPSGFYLRDKPDDLGAGIRRITVIGEESESSPEEETWLVFSKEVIADNGTDVGYVEIAFSCYREDKASSWLVQPVNQSSLVVFFPTILETHLGFLVEGPYRTTPSRDNVPPADPWNQELVGKTASLLVEALRWLRDHEMLDATALRCLPLDPAKFGQTAMFATLYSNVKAALSAEPLLPRFDSGYVPSGRARLARTQELRELLDPIQLAGLLGEKGELAWLSGDITQDRTPELRRYLMAELGIGEVTAEAFAQRLNKPFLEGQSDDWIVKLYEFLNGQQALRRRLDDLPIIRLEDRTQVVARLNGQLQAFLPGPIRTGFPTVRSAVCATDSARDFLKSLGLTEPDPVDDVIRNVLPKYDLDEIDVSDTDYEADIEHILMAFATDSKNQREKLIAVLRKTTFVHAVDADGSSVWFTTPPEVYLATERLKELFAGTTDILLVDDEYSCLRGEEARELLEACGATRYLQPVSINPNFTIQELKQMRVTAGYENISYSEPLQDQTLRGLDSLLALIPKLHTGDQISRANLLWEALAELVERRGTGIFSGIYRWHYHQVRSTTFDVAFVRKLNESPWVPDEGGVLQRPQFVLFEPLGWRVNPFLQSKIRFKPPIIETLAREAGFEPGVLDLLKKLGVRVQDIVNTFGLAR